MDLQTLKDNFALLADAPNGIPKLREMILELAVRGKLVPQDPNDEHASVLLKRISIPIKRTVSQESLRRSETLSRADFYRIPYKIPQNWEWVYLGDVILLISGQHLLANQYNHEHHGIPYITGPADFGKIHPIITKWTETPKILAKAEDILLTVKGAGIGKINIVRDNVSISRQLMAIRTSVNQNYVKIFLLSKYNELQARGIGIAIPGIGRKDILRLHFPCPPEAEQKRIVSNVDELMKLCDELEDRQKKRKKVSIRMNTACLQELTSPEPATSRRGWTRIRDHFDLLYKTPENVAALRQSILQLAVMGKLVPQDPNDEPASLLIKKIKAEKEKLIKEGKIKNGKPLPPVDPDEMPYSVPSGWEWVRLGDAIASMANGIYKPEGSYSSTGIACLRMYNINGGQINFDNIKRMIVDETELNNYGLAHGDILINRVNSRELVGKAGVIPKLQEPMIFESKNIRVRLMNNIFPDFVNIFLQSKEVRKVFEGNAKQTCGQASISQPQIAHLVFGLPPVAEQKRIATRVDELIKACKNLELLMTKALDKGENLMDVIACEISDAKRNGSRTSSPRFELKIYAP